MENGKKRSDRWKGLINRFQRYLIFLGEYLFLERPRGLDFTMRDTGLYQKSAGKYHGYSKTDEGHLREIFTSLDFSRCRRLLDVGCGSGILSVVALKYGANHALGTDLDPNAIIASEENSVQNNITKEQFEVIEGNIIDDKNIKDRCGYECYDIVCANILADVLEPLSVNIHEHMKHGAYFITSGIINTKEDEVVNAFKKNSELEIVEINHDGEWVNVTARRK